MISGPPHCSVHHVLQNPAQERYCVNTSWTNKDLNLVISSYQEVVNIEMRVNVMFPQVMVLSRGWLWCLSELYLDFHFLTHKGEKQRLPPRSGSINECQHQQWKLLRWFLYNGMHSLLFCLSATDSPLCLFCELGFPPPRMSTLLKRIKYHIVSVECVVREGVLFTF